MKGSFMPKITILLGIILHANICMANLGPPPNYYAQKTVHIVPKNLGKYKDYKFYYYLVNYNDSVFSKYSESGIIHPIYDRKTDLPDNDSKKLIELLITKSILLNDGVEISVTPKNEKGVSIYIFGQNIITNRYTMLDRESFPNDYKEGSKFIFSIDTIFKAEHGFKKVNGINNDYYYYHFYPRFYRSTNDKQNNFSIFINHDGNGKFNVYGLISFSILGTIGLIALFIVRKRNLYQQAWV